MVAVAVAMAQPDHKEFQDQLVHKAQLALPAQLAPQDQLERKG
jgi:hypothetical protein